ncbi:adhesion G protein-coupled receptor E4-like [Ciona intestinalis]
MVLFKTNLLFPTKQKNVSDISQVTQFVISGNNNSYDGNFQLINNDIDVTQMQPVPSKPQRRYQLECVKYNQNTEDWDEKNCKFEPGVGKTPSKCQCDSKYNPHSEEREEKREGSTFSCLVKEAYFPSARALSIVSQIGLIISMIGVFLTFVIYSSIKQLRNRQPTIFILNICVCLFVVYITFLFGIQATETKTTCDASAMILHYALLAFWFWCGANTLNLYKLIVKVFGSTDTLTPCVLYSACYGLPLLIVGINAGATIFTTDLSLLSGEESNYRHSGKCWLRHYSLYFGFLLPMGLIILFNVVVFVLVISKLTCKRDKIRSSKSQQNSAKEGLSLAVTLCFMMGFAWIFAYFLLIDGDEKLIEVMSWLFTLFNAGQGITIFYFNCLKQNQARRLWLDPLLAQCCNKKPKTKVESVEFSQTTNVSKL